MSIYQITQAYLAETFDPTDTDVSFTTEQTAELHNRLLASDPDYRSKTEQKEEVRRAFGDFYIKVANVALFFKGTEQIIVKLIPFRHDPDESVHIKKVSDYLLSTKHKFGKDDRQKHILTIPNEHVEAITRLLHEIPPPVDTRVIFRKAITEVFELEKRDSVFFMNGKVVIRFFKRIKEERRFEGLPPEEVKKIVETIYPENGEADMAGDLDMIISTTADTTLNFAEIDNLFFNTRHIKVIQEGLVSFYKTKIEQDETVVNAVANYIFRESFYYIHELLAEKLLDLIEHKNKNAEAFLRYYNGSTSIQNGEKYIIPEIVDEEGQKWNIAAIVNFISQFVKNKALITKKENSMRVSNSEEKALTEKLSASTPLADMIAKEKTPSPGRHEKVLLQLNENRQMLDKKRTDASDAFNTLPPEEVNEEFQKSIRDLQKRIDFLHMRTEGDQKAIAEIESTYTEQQRKYDMLIIAISEVLMDRNTPASIKD